MTRENIEALVRLGAPVSPEDALAISQHDEVTQIELSTVGEDFYLDAIHFTSPPIKCGREALIILSTTTA